MCDFLYLQGRLTECNKCRHFPSHDSSKAIFSFQTLKRIGRPDIQGRHVWTRRGQCHHFGKRMTRVGEHRRKFHALSQWLPVSRNPLGGSLILRFVLSTAPSLPKEQSQDHGSPHRAPCTACTMSAGAPAIFLSTTEGQGHILPTCFPPHGTDDRTLGEGHPGSGILGTHL